MNPELNTSSQTNERPARAKAPYAKLRKARYGYYGIAFALLFFIVAQFAASYMVKLDTVYKHRLNYDMFLADSKVMGIAVEELARHIKDEGLTDYAILIGNSVAWGTNESSEHSLGRYLSDSATADGDGKLQAVFNLSAPSMMAGDALTLLLMLDEHGIKTDNVMIGLTYSSFVGGNPGVRKVFWLGDDLKREDSATFEKVLPHLEAAGYKHMTGWKETEHNAIAALSDWVPVIKYKTVIPEAIKQMGKESDVMGDPRAWNEKQFSEKWITSPQYLNFFNPEPFDMTENNWSVYFMNRIAEHQQGKRLLVFVAGSNGELSKKEVVHPGYVANMEKIDSYLSELGAEYVMLQDRIEPDLFTDHVHLTKEGNQLLARIIWDAWTGKEA
ncbi:hypothetical protein D3P07_14715 [Paenibacillus sp. 1011MAR3C5]|uniref:hypothetical protein n=1 Tax=Paenibacillus sp. 1011MAR3C5 TaxID=1675787 RepID=UPI000E6CFA09|nr:hypothetical protein [Paenibacillus sp. 1011MAR3C5]RJE87568.1 hypothetical protein D3P07_14715 [Paenibacillus sp. 1011MAR3C5]